VIIDKFNARRFNFNNPLSHGLKMNDLLFHGTFNYRTIVVFTYQKMDDEALNMNSVIDKTNEGRGHKQGRHSDVQWKANLQLVATGNDNG